MFGIKDLVYWTDPDGFESNVYTVVKKDTVKGDNIYLIESASGTVATVWECELMVAPQRFLEEYFLYHYCEECGWDKEDHTAIPLSIGWFARCDKEPITDEEREARSKNEKD